MSNQEQSTTTNIPLLQEQVRELNQQMLHCEKIGKYAVAESLRLKLHESKKQLNDAKLREMLNYHNKRLQELSNNYQEDTRQFSNLWNQRMNQFHQKVNQQEQEMIKDNQKQCQQRRLELDQSLPIKLKESYQLLNLRVMLEHMDKQKNFMEAHRVQQKIAQLEKSQTNAFIAARNQKINIAIQTLQKKQAADLQLFRKKMTNAKDNLLKDRHIEEQRARFRYNNSKKEITGQNQRQRLSFKGELRTKVNLSSSQIFEK